MFIPIYAPATLHGEKVVLHKSLFKIKVLENRPPK